MRDIFDFDCPRCRRSRGLAWAAAAALGLMILLSCWAEEERRTAEQDLHVVAGQLREKLDTIGELELQLDVLRRQAADLATGSPSDAEKRNP